jgi:hypothetical protein
LEKGPLGHRKRTLKLGGREAIPSQNVTNTRTRARRLLLKSRFCAQKAVEIEMFSSPFKFDFLNKYLLVED